MQGQDEGQELTPVTAYLAERARDAARAVGVYALYNERQELQYVGYARNVAGAIQVKPWQWPEVCFHYVLKPLHNEQQRLHYVG